MSAIAPSHLGLLPDITAAIGHTPLVDLSRAVRAAGVEGRILAKLEYLNPGASRKDRVALAMVEQAEQEGRIRPGDTIVELTSGNTGTGLAIVSAVKGYKFVAVMSAGNSPERARMMRALGAEVVIVPQGEGGVVGQVSGHDLDLVERATERIVQERGAFRADQFALAANVLAHERHTGPEILAQAACGFDVFCDFIGSAGTFSGCAAAFKAHSPAIGCYAVEPAGAAVLAGEEASDPGHPIQGGGYSRQHLPLFRGELCDGFLKVTGDEARQGSRLLARTEGIFSGFSAGANFAAAVQLLARTHRRKTAVIVIPSSGLKYLSTDLWGT